MCGIVGMIGRERFSVKHDLIRSLQRLEYRGYDSCGVRDKEYCDKAGFDGIRWDLLNQCGFKGF